MGQKQKGRERLRLWRTTSYSKLHVIGRIIRNLEQHQLLPREWASWDDLFTIKQLLEAAQRLADDNRYWDSIPAGIAYTEEEKKDWEEKFGPIFKSLPEFWKTTETKTQLRFLLDLCDQNVSAERAG